MAFRIGDGTSVYMGIGSQYGKLYFGKPISLGRRIAMEVRECIENDCLDKVVTSVVGPPGFEPGITRVREPAGP